MTTTTDPPRGTDAVDQDRFRALETSAIDNVLLAGIRNLLARDLAGRKIRAAIIQARAYEQAELELYAMANDDPRCDGKLRDVQRLRAVLEGRLP